jgi:hypothetical protein
MATTIDPKVSGPVFDPASSDPWRDHAVAVPLVLLPVRVETRWFSTGDPAQLELRVRIYPDAVHVANRAEVSAAEREQTIAYWQVRLADGEAAATSRWGGLCADVGTARARWLRDRLAPTVGPDGQPQFPPASATPTVAVARGLPSRFAVALCAGAAVVGSRWGAPVPDELAVLDDRDFAAAEAVGLALRLTVARGTAIGLTHLVVFGLRGGAPNADQAVLEGLLGDHAIDRGLALLADGATTAAGDPGRPTIDAGGAAVALDDASDGARLARALGVTRDALALAAGATRDTDAVARAMATATWPATWGYFLESIVGSPIAADARAAGRSLFIDDVRAAGPLPILAVGRQPYGVLPVSALSRWRGDDGAVAPLASALQALLPRWVGAGELAPRLPATGDALPALQAILARQERSTRYRVRTAMAYDVATATWFGEDVDDARRAALHALLVTPLVAQLAALGVAVPDPAALTPLVYAEAAREVMAPLVGGVGPDAPAYLAALAAAPDPWKIRDGELAGASPRTILYALVRHATLLVLGRAADRLLGLPTDEWREPDVVPSATASVWDRMAQPIAAHGGQSARELLQKGEVIADSPELRAPPRRAAGAGGQLGRRARARDQRCPRRGLAPAGRLGHRAGRAPAPDLARPGADRGAPRRLRLAVGAAGAGDAGRRRRDRGPRQPRLRLGAVPRPRAHRGGAALGLRRATDRRSRRRPVVASGPAQPRPVRRPARRSRPGRAAGLRDRAAGRRRRGGARPAPGVPAGVRWRAGPQPSPPRRSGRVPALARDPAERRPRERGPGAVRAGRRRSRSAPG